MIYPTVQMGQLGIRQDSEVTSKVLASGEKGGVFHFGSGYFNLTAEYCHQMMHSSKADFRVLMAHPEANGFLGARGPAGGIPHAYTAIARGFWNLLRDRGLQNRIDMVEWKRWRTIFGVCWLKRFYATGQSGLSMPKDFGIPPLERCVQCSQWWAVQTLDTGWAQLHHKYVGLAGLLREIWRPSWWW